MEKFISLGQMSGTSLDGIDLVICEFQLEDGHWRFEVLDAVTIPYSPSWREKLEMLPSADGYTLWKTHIDYGHFLGKEILNFMDSAPARPDLISTHGHTIFHQPAKGFTMQAGAGDAIAAETGLPVVSDFRSIDVALGGQGAPLVPIGDRLLFGKYGACLNIGGFSNVSFEREITRTAFDICPANIVLNLLAEKKGFPYDRNGEIAQQGKVNPKILQDLNQLDYYSLKPPKSLGREWLEENYLPVLFQSEESIADLLRTSCEHIGIQVGRALQFLGQTEVLVTGGGAHNAFLVDLIRNHSHHHFMVPDRKIVDYKEAIIFAFLGVLRWTGRQNVLSSVTGCREDHSAGALYYPFTGK